MKANNYHDQRAPMNKFIIIFCLLFSVILIGCSGKLTKPTSIIQLNKQTNYALSLSDIDGLSDYDQQQFKKQYILYSPNYGIDASKNNALSLLKGYFSFENDGPRSTTVYYVFDVINQNGQRLHRLNGMLDVNGKLSQSDFDKMAQNVLFQVKKWRQQNS